MSFRVVGSLAGWCGVVLCLAASSLVAASPAGAVAGFGDVAEDRYYTEPVQWSVDNDVAGIDGNCFLPDEPVSRGEAAVYIWNMEGKPSAPAHSFVDVTVEGQDAAVSWMSHNEITTGTSPTTFDPGGELTRAHLVTFLWRLDGKPAAPAHPFVDVHASWQQGSVSWAADLGITTGTSPTTFDPNGPLTRAHLVTFLYRYQGEPEVTVDPASPECDPDAEVGAGEPGYPVVPPSELLLEVPGSASVVPRGGAVAVSWGAVGGLDEAAQSYLLSWRESDGDADSESSAVVDGLSHTVGGLSDELSYVFSVQVVEVNRVESVGAVVAAVGDAVPVVEQVAHPDAVDASMEVSPYRDPVKVTAPADTVWPINVAVPVDFSKFAPGDFLYLMHRPSGVDEWIPVRGARFDESRRALVADVYSDGLFMPIRAKSDVADQQELVRLAAEVPDILRGLSDFDHPFVRLLQGDAGAVEEVDSVLLSQYLEAMVDGLAEVGSHRVPEELIEDMAELVQLSKQHTPSAAVRVPASVGVTALAPHLVEGVTVYAGGGGGGPFDPIAAPDDPAGFSASAGALGLDAGLGQEVSGPVVFDLVGVLSYGLYGAGLFLGSRAPKPECGSDPPSWVQDILVVDDLNAEVFACGESIKVDELRDDLRLRIVSNRGYPIMLTPQQLFGDEPRVVYDVEEQPFQVPNLRGLILDLLRPLLAEDGQIFLQGTETVDLRFYKQSLRPILHLKFQSDASGRGLAVEVFISVLSTLLGELLNESDAAVLLFLKTAWDCFSEKVNQILGRGNIVAAILKVIGGCIDTQLDAARHLVDEQLKTAISNSLKRSKRVLFVAMVAKLAAEVTLKLSDFFWLGSVLSGVSPVTLAGGFTIRSPYVDPDPRPLGQWQVACPRTADNTVALSATSKDLYINLAAREEFSDHQYYLHEFSNWGSSAATAVSALTDCGAEGMAIVADYIQRDPENYWTEPRSTRVVAEKIYETFPELGFGDWTAVCDDPAADIAAMHSNLASLAPFSKTSAPYSGFKSFEPALEASAAPLKRCGPDYVIEFYERLRGSSVWTGRDRATVVAVMSDLLEGLPIDIPDANLEQAVRDRLDVAEGEPVTIGDARSAYGLNISDSDIADLGGLRYFINLRSLNASNNRITNLAPILGLQYLSNIDLSHNQIRDFAGLSGNDTITRLDISNNLATSLVLDKMVSLTRLDATNNQITNVALTELQSLTSVSTLGSSATLNLTGNPINELKLGGLRRLSAINLNEFPHLTNLELIALPNLTSLVLNNTSLTHIRLDAHTSLSYINLSNNQLTEAVLSRLPALGYLDLSGNELPELELADLPALRQLDLRSNGLERLVLRGVGLTSVTSHRTSSNHGDCEYRDNVCVGDNPLAELTIVGAPNLGSINLVRGPEGLPITTLESITLSDLPALSYLNIRNNQVKKLKLVGLDKLNTVNANNNELVEAHISALPALGYLDLSGNELPELELADLPALGYLDLSGNELPELELADLPALRQLDLRSNGLERLVLRGVGLTSVTSHRTSSNHGDCEYRDNVCVGDNPLAELTIVGAPNLGSINLVRGPEGLPITTLESITLSDLPALSYLNIRNNQVKKLKLVGLDKLNTVNANNNELVEAHISALPALGYLDLSGNELPELELADLPALGYLDLSGNELPELELADLPALRQLDLRSNGLERLVLRGVGLTSVTSHRTSSNHGDCEYRDNVCVGDNPLAELTIVGAPNLGSINLVRGPEGLPITTLESITLSDLPALSYLNIRNNQVKKLKLVGLDKLNTVNANNNELVEAHISALPALGYLDLSGNELPELELSDLPALGYLDLSGNELPELELADLPALRQLDLRSNGLERLVLRGVGLTSVTSHRTSSNHGDCEYRDNVCVGDNPLAELTIVGAPNLGSINLVRGPEGLPITTLESITLSDLPALSYLNIRNNQVKKLKLVGLDKLNTVNANNNHISDLSSIGSIISLVTLNLDHNDIKNVSPLASLMNLRALHIVSNLISDFTPLAGLNDLVIHGKSSQREE